MLRHLLLFPGTIVKISLSLSNIIKAVVLLSFTRLVVYYLYPQIQQVMGPARLNHTPVV